MVELVPDLIFRRAGRTLFVGDTKYKLLADEEKGRNPDYYQLLSYTTALNVPEGLLVYRHDDGTPPHSIVVEHVGTRLFVKGIRLEGTPRDVDAQLRTLADWIRGSLRSAGVGSVVRLKTSERASQQGPRCDCRSPAALWEQRRTAALVISRRHAEPRTLAFLLFACFWVLLWRPPSLGGSIAAGGILLIAALSDGGVILLCLYGRCVWSR